MTRKSPDQIWRESGYDPAYEPDDDDDKSWEDYEEAELDRAIDRLDNADLMEDYQDEW
jgi:hypothetical protein